MRRAAVILAAAALLASSAAPAQAGVGVHVIHSASASDTSFVVMWQRASNASYYTDGISPNQTEGEHRAQNGTAEPWAVRIMPGRCARFAFQNVPYGDWHCGNKVRWPGGRWVRVHPGDTYKGNWQTIVQYKYT